MINEAIFLSNGTLFAKTYERVVHGGRGDYVELKGEQIIPKLFEKFNGRLFNEEQCNKDVDFYYYWLNPETDKDTKVYYQLRTVKYADYKIGYYYISPSLLKDFKDPECLF